MNSSRHIKTVRLAPGVALGLILLAAVFARDSQADAPADPGFRVGFSSAMFTDVNENDAKAAVKVWGLTIAKERGIPTEPETRIFQNTPELLSALRSKTVDAVGITMVEYAAVSREVRMAPIFVTFTGKHERDEYLLLVRSDSKLDHLADLRGRSLVFHQNSRLRLAHPWLDTLLLTETGRPAAEWLGKIKEQPKLSKVVLPVFFHQGDACVVTRSSFETMCELNPQIGQRLKAIATSPEVVTAVFCFRADYAAPFKEELFAGIRDLDKSLPGQQVLTIFQSDRIVDEPASSLDSALEILAAHARFADNTRATNSIITLPPGGGPQTSGGAKL